MHEENGLSNFANRRATFDIKKILRVCMQSLVVNDASKLQRTCSWSNAKHKVVTYLKAKIVSLVYQKLNLLSSLQYTLYVVNHDVLHLIHLHIAWHAQLQLADKTSSSRPSRLLLCYAKSQCR